MSHIHRVKPFPTVPLFTQHDVNSYEVPQVESGLQAFTTCVCHYSLERSMPSQSYPCIKIN